MLASAAVTRTGHMTLLEQCGGRAAGRCRAGIAPDDDCVLLDRRISYVELRRESDRTPDDNADRRVGFRVDSKESGFCLLLQFDIAGGNRMIMARQASVRRLILAVASIDGHVCLGPDRHVNLEQGWADAYERRGREKTRGC
jgi:hypothetical protein